MWFLYLFYYTCHYYSVSLYFYITLFHFYSIIDVVDILYYFILLLTFQMGFFYSLVCHCVLCLLMFYSTLVRLIVLKVLEI